MRTLVATSFFLYPGIGVATSIRCRDLTLSTFTAFLCRDIDLMSRLHFCCHPLFFSVTAPLFMLRLHSVVLNLQKVGTHLCWSAYFLIATWSSGRDQVVSLISAIPVTTSEVCLELTVLPFAEIYVTTSIPCHDLDVLLPIAFCVATLILCHDLISFVSN